MYRPVDDQESIPTGLMPAIRNDLSGCVLKVVQGPEAGSTFAVSGINRVGRARDCDVVLSDRTVSRNHFVVRMSGDFYEIEDSGSGNGTSVNGRPVLSPVRLGNGDRISAGHTVIAFFCGSSGSPAGSGPEPALEDIETCRRPAGPPVSKIQSVALPGYRPAAIGTSAVPPHRGIRGIPVFRIALSVLGAAVLIALLFGVGWYLRSGGFRLFRTEAPQQRDADRGRRPDDALETLLIDSVPRETPLAHKPTDDDDGHAGRRAVTTRKPADSESKGSDFAKLFAAGRYEDASRVANDGSPERRLAEKLAGLASADGMKCSGRNASAVELDFRTCADEMNRLGLSHPGRFETEWAACLALMGRAAFDTGKDAAASDMARRALAHDSRNQEALALKRDTENRAATYFNRALDSLGRGLTRQAAVDFATVIRILPTDHPLNRAAVARMP